VGYLVTILLQIYCWVCWWNSFKICEYVAKLHARRLIVSHTVCA